MTTQRKTRPAKAKALLVVSHVQRFQPATATMWRSVSGFLARGLISPALPFPAAYSTFSTQDKARQNKSSQEKTHTRKEQDKKRYGKTRQDKRQEKIR